MQKGNNPNRCPPLCRHNPPRPQQRIHLKPIRNLKRRDDFFAQLLRANGDPQKLNKIIQDKCRRKAAKKLAATLALAPDFHFPTELSAEQATSDDLARFHSSLIPHGCSVVDLTAGLGIDDFHIALNASEVLSIEMNPEVEAALIPNARTLGISNIQNLCADSTLWLEQQTQKFDIAFIDPARRAPDGSRLYSLSQCEPNVTLLLDAIEAIAPRLIIKASPMLDISNTISELRNVAAIYAVGTRSECKELLIDIRFRNSSATPAIYAATVCGSEVVIWQKQPDITNESYAKHIEIGDTIGEPWPAVMKTLPHGQFNNQLHPSTLLFLTPPTNFPGNIYRIDGIEDFSSSTLRRLARMELCASVATRNFPLTAEQLRTRLKARESCNTRLLATTLQPNQQKLLFLSAISAKNA